MAKARIGHFVEAQILESLGVDYIDESEVLTPADDIHHINKHTFKVPFVCGCRDLGEALRRIAEGAGMIRTKGERREKRKENETISEREREGEKGRRNEHWVLLSCVSARYWIQLFKYPLSKTLLIHLAHEANDNQTCIPL